MHIVETKFASTVKPMTTPTDLKTTENMSVKKMTNTPLETLSKMLRNCSNVNAPSSVQAKPYVTARMNTNWTSMIKSAATSFESKIRSREYGLLGCEHDCENTEERHGGHRRIVDECFRVTWIVAAPDDEVRQDDNPGIHAERDQRFDRAAPLHKFIG